MRYLCIMGVKTIDIVATLALNLFQYAYAEHILSCNATSYNACTGHKQFCNQTTLQCECEKGYVRVDDYCESTGASDRGATAVVVSIFTIALIVCGLFLVVRKYNLIEYVRQKIDLRRNNDVMYEDVMIGNDDPPLSP